MSLFGKLWWPVVSIAVRLDLAEKAELGAENPWGDHDPLYNKNSDRLWLLKPKGYDFPIGHIRVCATTGLAEHWFNSMRDRTNVWAYWRFGLPLGPFEPPEFYRDADGRPQRIAMYRVKALSQLGAAKQACAAFAAGKGECVKRYEAALPA
jgi:hypothetical protein